MKNLKTDNQNFGMYAVVGLFCFLPRLISLCFNFPPTNLNDSNLSVSTYWMLSEELLRYGTLSINAVKTTAFEPLYALFLAGARWMTQDQLFLVLTLQNLIVSIGCIYLYQLTYLLSKSKRSGFVAALLYSFYPYLIYQTGVITEISLLATLLILFAYFYVKANKLKYAAYSGLFLGLALLTRSAALPILMLSAAAGLIQKRFRQTFIFLSVAVLTILPMAVRNNILAGSLMPTRGGENFFDGNSEPALALIPAYNIDIVYPYMREVLERERPDLVLNSSEMEKNNFLYQKGFQFIKENPGRMIRLKLRNIVYLFYPRIVPFHPLSQQTRLIKDANGKFQVVGSGKRSLLKELSYSMPYSFILIFALIGIYLRRNDLKKDLILYLIAFSFIVVYSIYFPTTKQRAAMDFILMFYAACAMDLWLKHLKTRV